MRKLLGGIFMGCGILIAGLSGLCVLILAGTFFSEFGGDMGGFGELASMLPLLLAWAGIPIAIGVGLFFAGRHLLRTPDEPKVDLEKNNPFE